MCHSWCNVLLCVTSHRNNYRTLLCLSDHEGDNPTESLQTLHGSQSPQFGDTEELLTGFSDQICGFREDTDGVESPPQCLLSIIE